MYFRFAVLIVLLSVMSVAGFAQANVPAKPLTPFEQTLMAAEKSYIEAAKKGGADFFKATLTDDFSFVGSDGELNERQDMIDELGGGGTDILPYDMKVVSISDSAAIVTYDAIVRVPPSEDQGPPPRYQHLSTIWVKQGGAWKMKFHQKSVAHWGDW
ncbi:MAG TPA: nuclear transport factor 2 family protein [Candidatus Solibacter sp.]|nr:nuclear transport factor 2 family protein [Candidatus Solibacter sp.]